MERFVDNFDNLLIFRLMYVLCFISLSLTDSTKINRPGHNIRMYYTERIYDSRVLIYNKIFLEKLL